MVEIAEQASRSLLAGNRDDSRDRGVYKNPITKNLEEAQSGLIDLIELSDGARESLESSSQLLDALDLYKDAYDFFLGDGALSSGGFKDQALALFEQNKGEIEAIIQKLEEKNAALNSFLTEQKKKEQFNNLASEIVGADTQGELSSLKLKLVAFGSGSSAEEKLTISKLKRLIELKEQGQDEDVLQSYSTFVSALGAGARFPAFLFPE